MLTSEPRKEGIPRCVESALIARSHWQRHRSHTWPMARTWFEWHRRWNRLFLRVWYQDCYSSWCVALEDCAVLVLILDDDSYLDIFYDSYAAVQTHVRTPDGFIVIHTLVQLGQETDVSTAPLTFKPSNHLPSAPSIRSPPSCQACRS